MSDTKPTVSISLDAELYRAAERCAAECGFASVQELLEYLVRQAVRPGDRTQEAEELAQVESRLRELGYLE